MTLARGARTVIGVGRVKTPTLAIVCKRELEIRNFVPQAYFEVIATAQVEAGQLRMRQRRRSGSSNAMTPQRSPRLPRASQGPLAVRVEDKRQGPPRLHDLPSLQKLCGSRFGWSAARTLEVAQELYDGQGKKVITYPRAETRYLPESLIADVPRIVAGLQVGRAFSTFRCPIRRSSAAGASGPFHDKGLAGASHHAVIPNVNTVATLREVWPRLSGDERRLFDVIARSYLAAMMPDFRYRQITATLDMQGHLFRAAGRQPIELGWRAAFPDWQPAEEKGEDAQLLPALRHGETALLRDAAVEDKETRPPPRYNEGTLIEAMQNAWRFVADEALQERLKEAKGIGTPATRAEIIRGLKAQDFLIADGKHIVPTERGLSLFAVLEKADPALVDPGVTAQMERLLDEVLVGQQEMVGAIDAVCAQASRIIGRLQEGVASSDAALLLGGMAKGSGTDRPPTPAMKRFVDSLARQKGLKPPRGYTTSGAVCRAFLDEHAPKKDGARAPLKANASQSAPSHEIPAEDVTPNRCGTDAPHAGATAPRIEKRSKPHRKAAFSSRKAGTGKPRAKRPDTDAKGIRSAGAPGGGTLLRIPFGNKEAALQLGARYRAGAWYAPAGVDLTRFRERGWL